VADVQLAKGYTRIANKILDALAQTKLNGTQLRILNVIIRNTYGYNKKTASLSDTFISKATGIHQKQVNREVNNLVEMAIVIVEYKGDYTNPRKIGLNKDFDTWRCNQSVTTNENVTTHKNVEESTNENVDKVPTNPLPNKDSYKDNIKKDIRPKKNFPDDSLEMHLSLELFNRIRANNPKFKEPKLQIWCKDIDLMMRKDERTPEDIRNVIEFAQADSFWKSNILSTKSLREKFDRLYMQSEARGHISKGKQQDIYAEVFKDLQSKQKEMIV
jgi:phage replication O-like protein O